LETTDLVLMGDKLELIPYALNLSRKAPRCLAKHWFCAAHNYPYRYICD